MSKGLNGKRRRLSTQKRATLPKAVPLCKKSAFNFARPYWLNRLQETWRAVPIAWLAGVRRSGQTTLAQSLSAEQTLYLNLEVKVCDPAGIAT